MNETTKIPLTDMLCRLQAQLVYATPQQAFDTLLYGWAKSRKHSTQWLSATKRRNWLTAAMAHDFEAYCGYKMT